MSTYSIYGLLVGIFVFMLGRTIISYREEARRFRLAERLYNTQEAEIAAILQEEQYNNTRYGRFYRAYIAPQFQRNPQLPQKIARLLQVDMEKLDIKIREARMDNKISVEEILSMKVIGLCGGLLFVFLGVASGTINLNFLVIGLILYYFGNIFPQRMLENKITQRKKEIMLSLPDFLDLLKSVTEAGLSIQEALTKVTARTKGALADEFRGVIVETKASGGQWRLAMENMAFRNDIDALSDVVSEILISYEKGTPISETLGKQASVMRQLRNNSIQEQARKLSIKMIIPMAIFSFLPFLILMLTPMIIEFTRNLY